MAERIEIEVELKEDLKKLTELDTSKLKLTQQQKDAIAINKKGAEKALENNDLKEFRRYFNKLADILKKASLASGKISNNLQELTQRQEEINHKIRQLKEKKDTLTKSITSSKGFGTLPKEKAKELLDDFKDKDKIIGKGKDPLQDPAIINQRVQKLAAELEKAGKTWSQLTNEMAQAAGFKDKNAAHAAHRFYESEQKYITTTEGQITDTETSIQNYETEAQTVADALDKIEKEAPETAEALEQLYSAIVKIKNAVNTKITDKQSNDRKEEGLRQEGTEVPSITPSVSSVNMPQQSSVVGKVVKQFTLYHLILKSVKKAVREAVQTVQELDKYLTEQAMVTGMSREQTYGLVKSYQELALQCGATTKEIAQVSTEYMKQGKTIQESLVLTEAAVKAAKVARVSVGDSVNYLTTALNGFRLEADQAMAVSDKFAAVAASSATDYDELAIALSKVASQANLAGMSIDYTTALLTKGLETTREAPETMGTALKTIIARMRELSDYGETLDDGMDINNVESQLKYVGIALRDSNGELRSTEDVLDELGHKWDDLNKNQQAAIAKALAGTRQQSRLIAMMDDYERVVELQEISTRSAGATAAQAGTYLEGMEAAINKIQVAWEKIVMTFSDSEFIIGAMNVISGVMDTIGNLLNSGEVMIPVLIAGATVMLKTIGLKLQEQHISKENAKIEARMNELRAKMNKEKLKADLKTLENQKEIYKGERAQQRITKEELYDAKIKQAVEKGDVELEKQLREEKERGLKEFDEETNKTLEFYDESISITKEQIKLQEEVIVQYERQKNAISSGANAVMGYATAFKDAWTSISQSVKGIIDGIKSVSEASKKASTPNQANSAAMIPMIGWIISLILLGGSLISTIIGIVAGIWKTIEGWIEDAETSAEGTAKAINALSAEIYNLNQQANQLDDISSKFEELDSKIVKTNKDLEEMESLLESAGESLNTEEAGKNTEEALRYGEGNSQKESYQIAVQDGRASEWLEEEEEWLRGQANSRRQEQLEKVENMKESEKEDFFDEDTSSAEIKQAQGAIKAINQNTAYEYIDYLKETTKVSNEAAKATEDLTSQILKNLSVEDAYNYAQSEDAVASLVDSLIQLEQTVTDLEGEKVSKTIAEILQSDDYSLKEQVAAYNSAIQALEGIEEEAFKAAYVHMEFWTGLTDNVLDFIDAVGMSADEINKWHITGKKLNSNDTFWSNLGLDGSNYDFESIWEDRFNSYISTIAELNGDVAEATRRIFGDFLGDQEENMNYFLNAYADIVEVGILDMGQNIDKIRNSINGFYEKALEWNTMSESDKTAFIQDHMDLFTAVDDAGNQIGSQLLKAFESGDYAAIENALNENTALRDLIEKRKEEIEQALLIEREKTGKDRNEAYISQLEEYKSYLNDVENLFKASLELRLEQEKKQLDEYRNYLEEQKDALTESLEKRKDAYDKYFDSISETEEDEDYEKETSTLIANISRLSSSSNADAKQQTAELEQELRALEEERLQTLKERAREAILENMESEISEINEKFDKLLDSSQALLYAMNGELDNPVEFMSNMISTQIESGASALEVEDYINSLQSTYGSVLGDSVDWDAIQVREENNQLILNVNGQDIVLNQQDERSVYEAVKKALRAVGLR